jgi:HAMP domain-containing protein
MQRQKLIEEMRELGELYAEESVSHSFPGVGELLRDGADEIERLSAEVRKLRDELDLVRRDEERFIYD